MRPESRYDWFVLTLRLLIGVLFLVTGAIKAFFNGGPAAFADDVSHFHVLMDPWNLVVAYFLPWLEIIAGGCLLGGFLVRGAALIAQGMTLAFIFGIGQAWFRGLDISCGCFGKSDIKVNYPLHTSGLVLLVIAIALVQIGESRQAKSSVTG